MQEKLTQIIGGNGGQLWGVEIASQRNKPSSWRSHGLPLSFMQKLLTEGLFLVTVATRGPLAVAATVLDCLPRIPYNHYVGVLVRLKTTSRW